MLNVSCELETKKDFIEEYSEVEGYLGCLVTDRKTDKDHMKSVLIVWVKDKDCLLAQQLFDLKEYKGIDLWLIINYPYYVPPERFENTK